MLGIDVGVASLVFDGLNLFNLGDISHEELPVIAHDEYVAESDRKVESGGV